ncbi:MAG TPA: UDP-N-acetylglucosamine 2-epimerase (non-hydrolyzing) [Candidatus Acidoferrum sp.]|nr:UDP-N-acetylglucosamine 2-epimerase (non-hydrolyzing) [Candidatus Acidoferrum sp.]
MDTATARRNGSSVKWISIVGARPQFVKLAPVTRAIATHNALNRYPRIDHCIIHTGQHYDREVNKLLFHQMQIPEPDYNLSVGSGSHGQQIARMIGRLEPILLSRPPDWVVVYGDTNSTLAGAILAARLNLPTAHVEAGCRSDNLEMPEEQNRIVTDHLSRLLLAPSQMAVENLHREGIGTKDDPLQRTITMVGDVMYDALLHDLPLTEVTADETLRDFGLEKQGYYLLTVHRAENTDRLENLRVILETASNLDLPVLFPVHPRTQHIIETAGIILNGKLRAVAPLGYFEMLALEKHSRKILTDSGGVQKEAFYLKVPCVTLRDRTEWPETVSLRTNCTAGISRDSILSAVATPSPDPWPVACPYGEGNSADRILTELLAATGHRTFAAP